MDQGVSVRSSRSPLLIRAVLLGAAIGGAFWAGSVLVLGPAPIGGLARAVVGATATVAAAVGLWAGTPQAGGEEIRIGERWLTAAALTALGGSFATFRALYEPVLPGSWWAVGSLVLALAIPIYAACLVAPALLAASGSLREELGDEGEGSDAWSDLGHLTLGSMAGLTIGTFAGALAAIPGWSPSMVLMVSAVVLLVPLALPAPATEGTTERDLYHTVSPFAELRVSEVVYPGERQPERRLYLNEEEESSELVRSGAPTLAYIAAAESWLSHLTSPGSRYLFLGGGAYTLPRRVAERDRRARIDVVELDPEVTAIARRFFGLNQALGVRTIQGDARAYLNGAPSGAYDRVYVDVYGGDERLPHSLVSVEAISALADVLAPGGIAAVNVIGMAVGDERRQLWSVVKTFASVFPNVALYFHLGRDYPERQNFLLAGTADPARDFPDRAGQFERWREAEWPEVEGTIVYRDLHLPAEGATAAVRPAHPGATRSQGQTAN